MSKLTKEEMLLLHLHTQGIKNLGELCKILEKRITDIEDFLSEKKVKA